MPKKKTLPLSQRVVGKSGHEIIVTIIHVLVMRSGEYGGGFMAAVARLYFLFLCPSLCRQITNAKVRAALKLSFRPFGGVGGRSKASIFDDLAASATPRWDLFQFDLVKDHYFSSGMEHTRK